MSTDGDAALGRLVRRMPKESSLEHEPCGAWRFLPPGFDVIGAVYGSEPEEALHGLGETFTERWLHYYDCGELDLPGTRAYLYTRAVMEAERPPRTSTVSVQ